ncbi:MAG: hypothetical protein LBQ40_05080 [Clostridiales bacterium]|jgi:hypothetical protein|nr:hypothetical protein [Clostridiales bacterium]
MKNSEIKNPYIAEIWGRAVWTGQPQVSGIKLVVILFLGMLVPIFGIVFLLQAENKMGGFFYVIIIALGVLFFLTPVVVRKLKWENKSLIFALTNDEIYFSSERDAKDANGSVSWFCDDLSNISGYEVKPCGDGTATVTLFFKTPSNAGMYGNLKKLSLVKVSNAGGLQSALGRSGIPQIKAQ